jgi:hypothetical protein
MIFRAAPPPVARTFEVTGDQIAQTRGGIERQLLAYLAEEGLIPLRMIAAGSASRRNESRDGSGLRPGTMPSSRHF